MEEKEIDYVVADDLQAGDLIMVNGVIETVKETGSAGDLTLVYTIEGDRDEFDPLSFQWDERVTIYGY